MAHDLTIDSVDQSDRLMLGWRVSRAIGCRGVFTFKLRPLDSAYHVALDKIVSLVDDQIGPPPVFGGFITSFKEDGIGHEPTNAFITTVTAGDFNDYARRRFIFETIPAGSTLKQALQQIVPYIAPALNPSQVNGPTLPELVYDGVRSEDVLNDLTTQSGGYVWELNENQNLQMYLPGTVAAPFNIISGPGGKAIGDISVEPQRKNYANRVLVRNKTLIGVAIDAGEVAANGFYEYLVTAADEATQAELDSLAALILAQRLPTPKVVRYRTKTAGLYPGQTQTITVSERSINNTFLITNVDIIGTSFGAEYTVTAIEGTNFRTDWREVYRIWSATSTPVASVVGAGGGGGGAGVARYAYFLGGSGVDAVRSATPTWVPAAGGSTTLGQGSVLVQINTVPRGGTDAVVTARLRALDAGVSVQARLYDVSAAAACPGTSSVVTSTTWQTVTFAVTLTAGSHLYELQLLPGTANKDVLGTGYVE